MLRPIPCSVVRFEQKILKICDFNAISVTKIFFFEKNEIFENFWIFWKIFKNRKISKCSKMTYFASILFKRAYDRNETMFCRFLTKKNFGKFFEKFWNSTKILKNRKFSNFFFENRPCAWCATCAHIRHTNFRASKKVNSAS